MEEEQASSRYKCTTITFHCQKKMNILFGLSDVLSAALILYCVVEIRRLRKEIEHVREKDDTSGKI